MIDDAEMDAEDRLGQLAASGGKGAPLVYGRRAMPDCATCFYYYYYSHFVQDVLLKNFSIFLLISHPGWPAAGEMARTLNTPPRFSVAEGALNQEALVSGVQKGNIQFASAAESDHMELSKAP